MSNMAVVPDGSLRVSERQISMVKSLPVRVDRSAVHLRDRSPALQSADSSGAHCVARPLLHSVTGEGLAFGQPGANKQWAKADVVFEYRDFKTLLDSGSSFPLSDAEEAELRGLIEDDDCIEVFFIRDLTPQGLHGGGVTFGAGPPARR